MRLPWQTRPGMVRVSHRRLIQLQRDALTTAEHELADARRLEAEARAETARQRAAFLILCSAQHRFSSLEVRGFLFRGLPVGEDGRLDEAAFVTTVFDEAALANGVDHSQHRDQEA